MSYEVRHAGRSSDAFGSYKYDIYAGGKLVAGYWHDYRGDEHGIEIAGCGSFPWPVGRMIDFLEGGGPTPVRLSAQAVSYLDQKLAR